MISLRKPTYNQLKEYLWQQQDLPFTYAELEATRGTIPSGYSLGHKRVQLGHGRECYLAAKQALEEWKMFPADFVELIWPGPLEVGRVVATLFRAPLAWAVNPCSIVYTLDESTSDEAGQMVDRFGFAYGTVGRHLAAGEELFSVEYHHADRSVWYEVLCFSKVNHWLAALTYPYFRMIQVRFRAKSVVAMQEAVAVQSSTPAIAMARYVAS